MTAVDTTGSRTRRERNDAVPLSTRVSIPTRDLIDDVAEREGISIRDVVEQAILARWGSAA
jgi:uncharacterized protein (DUF1778 family)